MGQQYAQSSQIQQSQPITSADIERIVNTKMQTYNQPQAQTYQQPQTQIHHQPVAVTQALKQPSERFIIPEMGGSYVNDLTGGKYNFEDLKLLARTMADEFKKRNETSKGRKALETIAENLGYDDNASRDETAMLDWINDRLNNLLPKDPDSIHIILILGKYLKF